MNTQQRTDLLAALTELGQRYPDWRFGQLVANVAGWADQEIWDVADEQLLEAARLHLQQAAVSANGLNLKSTLLSLALCVCSTLLAKPL